jgi:pyridoxine 4-dehydrogenase
MKDHRESNLAIAGSIQGGRIGFGAMQLTGRGVWGEYGDREGGIALLRRVVDAGVTFIDTADAYGPHTNELLIHGALWPYPAGVVIATKGGFVRGLRQCVQLSARRLGVDCIDLYYLHRPYATDARRTV